MSIALYSDQDVFHTSWIEMRDNVTMRYELDPENEIATLYFGYRDNYVLALSRENLERLLGLGAEARRELAAPSAGSVT